MTREIFQPGEVKRQINLSRREFAQLLLLTAGEIATFSVWKYLFDRLAEIYPVSQVTLTPDSSPVEIRPKPAQLTMQPESKKEPQKPKVEIRDPFQVGPFNLKGFGDSNLFTPAPPIFIFTQKPDGKFIPLSFTPKELDSVDMKNEKSIQNAFDWRKNVNATFFNVQRTHDGLRFGDVITTAHSGWDLLRLKKLPGEEWRSELEDRQAFYRTVRKNLGQPARARFFQGDLARGVDWSQVKSDGTGLVNPVYRPGWLTGIAWMSPEQTDRWETQAEKALRNPGVFAFVNDYVPEDDRVIVPPGKGFRTITCSNQGGLFQSRFILSFSVDI